MNDVRPYLSAEGERRRETIGGMARVAARELRQRRSRRRMIAAGSAGLLLISVGVAEWSHFGTRLPPPRVVSVPARSVVVAPPSVTTTWIDTDPNIAARLSLPRQMPRWRVVGDDDLLQTLAEAGHPAGLVRMNGQAILLSR